MGVNEINECDVKIVFPLIVECDVTNPTTDISSDGSITLLINGGTPPYDITWNDGNVGKTLLNLTQGSYTAVVVDYYGNSATTTCSLVRPEPTTTTTTTTLPPEPTLYDICMVITNGGLTYNNFYPDGYYNSKNAWISDDENKRIVWDNVNNYWYVSGSSYNIINTNTNYPPINGWQLLGSTATVSVSLGECDVVTNLSGNAVINNPLCSCDGSVTLTALDGVPPYQYSINNGNTFGDSPLFNGLCGGVYNWVIKDSEDNTFSGVNTLTNPLPKTTYIISKELIYQSTPNDYLLGANTLTSRYQFKVTPPLPAGVTITFDVFYPVKYQVSPNPNSYLYTINSNLIKNGTSITKSSEGTSSSSVLMINECASSTNKVYEFNQVTNWDNITMVTGDVIIVESVITSTYNCDNSTPESNLYEIDEIYSFGVDGYGLGSTCCSSKIYNDNSSGVQNIRINGCQCCDVVKGWEYYYTRK